jgi:hypothetical protein
MRTDPALDVEIPSCENFSQLVNERYASPELISTWILQKGSRLHHHRATLQDRLKKQPWESEECESGTFTFALL